MIRKKIKLMNYNHFDTWIDFDFKTIGFFRFLVFRLTLFLNADKWLIMERKKYFGFLD